MMQVNKDQYYRNLSLDYKNRAKMKRCRAAIHVEDQDDQPFWAFVLAQYLPNHSFDFIVYTRSPKDDSPNITGCEVCLKYKKLGCLSDGFLIAIDSDYRYLLQEANINAANFVLQTYTYSIENHYCYPRTINKTFETKYKFKNTSFDFEIFLKDFSEAIYPFYIYYLHSLKNGDGKVTKEDFFNVWDFHPPMTVDLKTNGQNYLDTIRSAVSTKLGSVQSNYASINFADIEVDFQNLGLLPNKTYMYVRGHNLFDKLISSIIKQIYKEQVNDYTQSLSVDESREYLDRALNSNHEYFSQSLHFDYPEASKIGDDIQFIFNS